LLFLYIAFFNAQFASVCGVTNGYVISVLANYCLLFQYVTNPKAINDMVTTCKTSKACFQHQFDQILSQGQTDRQTKEINSKKIRSILLAVE
jgi:hypothetical protein